MESNFNESNYNYGDIAVIGIGCRLPGDVSSTDDFFKKLSNQLDAIQTVPESRWSKSFFETNLISSDKGGYLNDDEWKKFDNLFFGMNPKESQMLDPQQRVLLKCLWEALEDSCIKPESIRGSNTACFIGLTTTDYGKIQGRSFPFLNSYWCHGNAGCFFSNRLSFTYDLRGTSLSIETACSSSMNAIFMGVKALQSGLEDIAVVGGTNCIFDPTEPLIFTQNEMLSKSMGRCRSFEDCADGYVRSEGAGIIIMKRACDAVRDGDRIYAIVKGGSSNMDGQNHKDNIIAPSMHAQKENIELALKKSNINPKDILMVEAHGTGTPTGDPTEVEAISMVFKDYHSNDNPLRISSVKTNIGHLEAASGVGSFIKTCLMLKNRKFIPNIHFERINPKIKLTEWNIKVQTELEDFPNDRVVRIGINNFGMSGSNVHLILEEPPRPKDSSSSSTPISTSTNEYLIPFSANSITSLEKYIDKINQNKDDYSKQIQFKDFVKHLCLSKTMFSGARNSVVAKDWSELEFEKSSQLVSSTISNFKNEKRIPVVFVFAGQGPQYIGMLNRGLYENDSTFRDTVNHCDALLAKWFGYSILEKVNSLPLDSNEINKPAYAQPYLFLLQIGLIEMYKKWGITPSIVLGHSFGEVAASYCANIIDLETAVTITYYRATLQNQTVGSGRMLSVGISQETFIKNYSTSYPSLEVSCINSDDSIVVSGAEDQLKLLSDQLQKDNIFSTFLSSLTAFHSSKQESIKEGFFNSDLLNIRYPSGEMKTFFSTHHGNQIFDRNEMNAQYIYDNVRNTVQFSKAIKSVFNYLQSNQESFSSNSIFLEIAPTPTLAYYIKKSIPSSTTSGNNSSMINPLIITSLNKKSKTSNLSTFNSTISSVFKHGLDVNFECQFNGDELDATNNQWKDSTSCLPRYQWDEQSFFFYPLESKKKLLDGPSTNTLGNRALNGIESYHSIIDTSTRPYAFLKDHKVKGKCLVPGSSYIDNILEIFKGKDILIHNLEFNMPVFLVDGSKYELQTNLIPSSKNEYKVEFYFRLDLNSESWTRVSHGRITVYPPTPSETISMVDLNQLKSKCNLANMSKQDVYKKCSTMGLDYGYHFQHVEYLLVGNNCSFSKLNLNPSTSFLDTKNFLNASIMDSFIHCFITILEGKYELVFECLKNFTLYESNIPSIRPDSVYVYSTIESQRGNNSIGKILVYSENGNLLVSYGSVVVNSLIKNKPFEMKNPSKYLYSIDWQEKESSINNNVNDNNNIFTLLENNLPSIGSSDNSKSTSKSLVRILDCSCLDLNNTNKLINLIIESNNKNNNSIIEYTKLCKNNEPSFIESLSNYKSKQIKLLSTIDKNESLVSQGLMVSSYDLVINSQDDDDDRSNKCLNQVLSPNGLYVVSDNIGQIVSVQQKSNINELKSTKSFDNIIVLSPSNEISNRLSSSSSSDCSLNYYNSSIILNNNEKLIEIIKSSSNKETLIIYSPGSEELNVETFKDKAFEYSKLNQLVLENKFASSVSIVLLTFNALFDSSNYFSSSLIGASRYFKLFGELNSIFIDIDENALETLNLSTLMVLSDKSVISENEFVIRDDKIYIQKIFERPELFNNSSSSSGGGDDINLSTTDNHLNEKLYKLNMKLEYIEHTRDSQLLGDYEVEIQVKAVGVNYKDSLYYRALLPQEIFAKGDVYNPPIGLECSGIISNVGSKSRYQIGDEVVGLVPHSYSTFVITNQDSIVYKPKNISFEQAASIPMVYMSAYYSLYHLGRLENDESVLIHSACGGVGLAALNLLKWKGHSGQIFVTIGGHIKEKKKYLLDNYGDSITKVFSTQTSSVSKRYSDRIRSINGKGVDVILNTLSGEFMKYNFDSLSEIGRIMDLSMTQLIDNDNIDLEMFKYNVGYNTIDIERVVRFNPKVTNRILNEIFSSIQDNQLSISPIREFSVLNTKEAIDYVNNRTHIGKIVVSFSNFNQMLSSQSNITINSNFKLNSLGSTLLITVTILYCQTGISPIIIKWIVKHSPKHLNNIIVLSKSEAKWEIQKIINQLSNNNNNIKIHYKSVDISNYKLLKESMNQIYLENPSIAPVDSIIHLATVYEYGGLSNISKELLNGTFDPKVVGAFNLYELSKELNWKLKQLLLFSSVASITGIENQLAYSSANCVLDSFANFLNSSGYCNAKSISWGALDGSGEAANNRSVSTFLKSKGYEFVLLSKILGGIFMALNHDTTPSHFMISKFRYPLFLETNKHMKMSMGHLLDSNSMELKQQQNDSNEFSSTDSVSNKLVNYIADLLSINPSKLNLLISLKSYGIDSLFSVQLQTFITSQFNISFTHLQLSTNSIQFIIQKIQNNN